MAMRSIPAEFDSLLVQYKMLMWRNGRRGWFKPSWSNPYRFKSGHQYLWIWLNWYSTGFENRQAK